MSVTSVRIENDLKQPLKTAAASMRRTKNWIINEALREFLQRRWIVKERWRDTIEGLEDIRRGRVVDGDKVFAWLHSWGSQNELEPPIE